MSLPLELADLCQPPPGPWLLVERCQMPTAGRYGVLIPAHYRRSTMAQEAVVRSSNVDDYCPGDHVLLGSMAGDPIFFGGIEERTLWRVDAGHVVARIRPAATPVTGERDPFKGSVDLPEHLARPVHAEGDPRGVR